MGFSDKLGEAVIEITAKTKPFEQGVKKAEQTAKRSSAAMSRSFEALGASIKAALGPLLAFAAAYKSVTSALSAGANLEQLNIAFKSIIGNAKVASDLMEKLVTFAAKTPFQMQEIASSAKQLLAAGVGADKVLGIIEELGNVSSAVSARLDDVAMVYAEIISNNKAYTQDLRQLTSRGIPILQVLADMFGVNKDMVRDLAAEGQLTGEVMAEAFRRMGGEGGMFFGLIEAQSKSLAGKWSTLLDSLELLGAALVDKLMPALSSTLDRWIAMADGAANFLNWVSPGLGKIRLEIENMGIAIYNNLTLGFQQAKDVFVGMATTVSDFLSKWVPGFERLKNSVVDFATGSAGAISQKLDYLSEVAIEAHGSMIKFFDDAKNESDALTKSRLESEGEVSKKQFALFKDYYKEQDEALKKSAKKKKKALEQEAKERERLLKKTLEGAKVDVQFDINDIGGSLKRMATEILNKGISTIIDLIFGGGGISLFDIVGMFTGGGDKGGLSSILGMASKFLGIDFSNILGGMTGEGGIGGMLSQAAGGLDTAGLASGGVNALLGNDAVNTAITQTISNLDFNAILTPAMTNIGESVGKSLMTNIDQFFGDYSLGDLFGKDGGLFNFQESNEMITMAGQQFSASVQQGGQQFSSTIQQAAQQFASTVSGASKSLDTAATNLDGVGNSLSNLGASFGGGFGGGGGGILGGLFGGGGGLFGGFFADGGTPPMGKVSVVGENGPELFVPKVGGSIMPNDMMGSGGGVTVVNNNDFSNTNAVNRAELMRALENNRVKTESSILGRVQSDPSYGNALRGRRRK